MNHRPWLVIRIDALIRKILWYTASRRTPLYLVAEYPRSGGTWFSQMLAAYLDVPFPRNEIPRLEPCIMHGHQLYSPSFHNTFCIVRDGRDALVSEYFHLLLQSDRNYPAVVRRHQASVPFDDYEDVYKNMPAFLEFMFTCHDKKWSRFTWSEFAQSWGKPGIEIIKYEELLAGAAERMARALKNVLGLEPEMNRLREIEHRFSFETLSKRKRGEENTRSFMRKGVAGDWKEKFSREACQVFDHYAGEELVRLGYEKDRSWVENAGSRPAAPSQDDTAARPAGVGVGSTDA